MWKKPRPSHTYDPSVPSTSIGRSHTVSGCDFWKSPTGQEAQPPMPLEVGQGPLGIPASCDTSEQLEASPSPVLNILLGSDSLCGALGQMRGPGGGCFSKMYLQFKVIRPYGDTGRSEPTVLTCPSHTHNMYSNLLQPKGPTRTRPTCEHAQWDTLPARESTNTKSTEQQ